MLIKKNNIIVIKNGVALFCSSEQQKNIYLVWYEICIVRTVEIFFIILKPDSTHCIVDNWYTKILDIELTNSGFHEATNI